MDRACCMDGDCKKWMRFFTKETQKEGNTSRPKWKCEGNIEIDVQ